MPPRGLSATHVPRRGCKTRTEECNGSVEVRSNECLRQPDAGKAHQQSQGHHQYGQRHPSAAPEWSPRDRERCERAKQGSYHTSQREPLPRESEGRIAALDPNRFHHRKCEVRRRFDRRLGGKDSLNCVEWFCHRYTPIMPQFSSIGSEAAALPDEALPSPFPPAAQGLRLPRRGHSSGNNRELRDLCTSV